MEYIVGNIYEISCAQLRWREDRRIYDVPVFDHFHNDPQFDFPHFHYHIDGRFELHTRMRHFFQMNEGMTRNVITKSSETFEFLGIYKKALQCIGLQTGLNFSVSDNGPQRYKDWYADFIGHECKGKRCPHFGTEMLEKQGMLICPMHGLVADKTTLKIIPRELIRE